MLEDAQQPGRDLGRFPHVELGFAQVALKGRGERRLDHQTGIDQARGKLASGGERHLCVFLGCSARFACRDQADRVRYAA